MVVRFNKEKKEKAKKHMFEKLWYRFAGGVHDMKGELEYKTALFIENVLRERLEKNRKKLIEQRKDKDCPVENYENTLDFCTELEYAIQQIERFKT